MPQPFRIEPKMGVGSYKTYQVLAPAATHFRKATCAEVNCGPYLNGWRTTCDESTELGKAQASYIRNQSGRHYTEDRNQAPGLTVFTFEAGQACFQADKHEAPRFDRPQIYLVRGGDHRGNTGLIRRHTRGADWVEDFTEHQLKLADQVEKG